MLLDGLQLPLTTPFYSDGRLNLNKMEHNVARYSKTPAAGLVALSETGEPSLLSDEETRHVLRSVASAAADEKVLLAGIGRDSLIGTLDLVESAAEFGFDAVFVRRPQVLRDFETLWGARALLTYFQAVADRSALPLVLSDHGGQLSDEIVVELAGHPKILGYVCGSDDGGKIEAIKTRTVQIRREVTVTPVFAAVTGRMQSRREDVEAKEMILASALSDGSTAMSVASPRVSTKTRTKVVGFQILAGRTSSMLKGLLDGAVGALPPFGAAAPQACYEVLAAWKDGDQGLAQEKQERVQGVAARIEAQMGIAGIKFGCDLNGYFGGVPRLPLLPLSGEERSEIEVLMQGMRN